MFELIVKKDKKKWYLNGDTHRAKGPAIEFLDGEKWWCKNGFMHRDNNLPAIEKKNKNINITFPNQDDEYWENGQQYKLQDNGTREFIDLFGNLHRKNLPAVEYSNGDQEWWGHGKRHRKDGPAVIIGNKKFWFQFGEVIKCMI